MDKTEIIAIMKLSKPLAQQLYSSRFNLPITEYEGSLLVRVTEAMESPHWSDIWVIDTAGISGYELAALRARLEYHFKRAEQLGGDF